MRELIIIVLVIAFCWVVEVVYNAYLSNLPPDVRDRELERQSEMRCSNCGSKDFEVVGYRLGKLKFQCKYCKKIK